MMPQLIFLFPYSVFTMSAKCVQMSLKCHSLPKVHSSWQETQSLPKMWHQHQSISKHMMQVCA